MNINPANIASTVTENFVELADGRRLCYAEYGNPKGRPIIVLHGGSNSRLLWGVMPGSPFLPDVRLIAPDRPGFGQTDFVRGVTTLENWPNDIVALADSLGLEEFAVFGPSGGGPYALACAWKIPERLSCVGIYAGIGPLLPETSENLAVPVRLMWEKAPKMLGLFRAQLRMFAWLAKRFPRLYVKMIMSEFSETDRKNYHRLGVGSWIQNDRNEGYRQKGAGMAYDATIPAAWPIPLDEITAKVYLWQGEEDISVPLAMGRYVADRIPNCDATFIEGAGHFWIFEHLREMLEKLVNYYK